MDEKRRLAGDIKAALGEIYAGGPHFYIPSGELPSPWGNGDTVPPSPTRHRCCLRLSVQKKRVGMWTVGRIRAEGEAAGDRQVWTKP
jgi:hypothetical protein